MTSETNPVQSLLLMLPTRVRRVLYGIVTVVGAALALMQGFGVTDLGPVTMTQALGAYAIIAPFVGGVAIANVGRPDAGADVEPAEESSGLGDFVGGVDLSDFEPVGPVSEVYGTA